MIKSPGLFVRLLVIVYDSLLLAGVVFAAHMFLFIVVKLLPDVIADNILIKVIHFSLLVFVSFLFYGWFWVNGGQTLGMKTWKLYLIKVDSGNFIDWRLAAKRYIFSLISWLVLAMGFLWVLVHRENKTWHDMLTNTQIVKMKN